MRRDRSPFPRLGLAGLIVAVLVLLPAQVWAADPVSTFTVRSRSAAGAAEPAVQVKRLASPARSVVSDDRGWVATFTDGARTVTLAGPQRTFGEASTPSRVVTTTWVRLLPKAFAGQVDVAWLTKARADTSPDVLAVAFQYAAGAPTIRDASGRRIAGDASYGPLQADGTRQEGSDFNDYLGRAWTYPDGIVDAAEAGQLGALDCSGFARMVFGFRGGLALSLQPVPGALPRRSFEIAASGPGVGLIANRGVIPADRRMLAPGDLLFFDAATNDGTQLDHVAIYLGRDTAGHDRFISSRKGADGPTMGDTSGASIIDGTGFYARSFRSARRL